MYPNYAYLVSFKRQSKYDFTPHSNPNNIYSHEWGDSAMIFTSHKVTNLNHCQNASQTSVFTITYTMFYFLHAIGSLIEHTNLLKQSSIAHFIIFTKDGTFLLGIVTSPHFYLWRHANMKYCPCDVIFVYCSCMHKLAQRRSSLASDSRKYRFPATWYSRLSV